MEIGLGIAGLIIGALVAWYLTGQMANSRAKKFERRGEGRRSYQEK